MSIDMRATIIPKSDQLNADGLIGRTLTIKVTDVSRCPEPQQPIAIHFEGDDGKPYKPCLSMRRVLLRVWGEDGKAYVGRSMTLFRDDKVRYGGQEIGGIRISHMSGIDDDVTMVLTETKQSRRPYTVRPLREAPRPKGRRVSEILDEIEGLLAATQTPEQVQEVMASDLVVRAVEHVSGPAKERLVGAIEVAKARVAAPAQETE